MEKAANPGMIAKYGPLSPLQALGVMGLAGGFNTEEPQMPDGYEDFMTQTALGSISRALCLKLRRSQTDGLVRLPNLYTSSVCTRRPKAADRLAWLKDFHA
jgi:hypothetical protein